MIYKNRIVIDIHNYLDIQIVFESIFESNQMENI